MLIFLFCFFPQVEILASDSSAARCWHRQDAESSYAPDPSQQAKTQYKASVWAWARAVTRSQRLKAD